MPTPPNPRNEITKGRFTMRDIDSPPKIRNLNPRNEITKGRFTMRDATSPKNKTIKKNSPPKPSEDDDDDDNDVICFRCGREGHYANSCYASKHIRGYYLR